MAGTWIMLRLARRRRKRGSCQPVADRGDGAAEAAGDVDPVALLAGSLRGWPLRETDSRMPNDAGTGSTARTWTVRGVMDGGGPRTGFPRLQVSDGRGCRPRRPIVRLSSRPSRRSAPMGQAADATTSSRNGASNPGQLGPGWVVWVETSEGQAADAAHGLPDLPCTWGVLALRHPS